MATGRSAISTARRSRNVRRHHPRPHHRHRRANKHGPPRRPATVAGYTTHACATQPSARTATPDTASRRRAKSSATGATQFRSRQPAGAHSRPHTANPAGTSRRDAHAGTHAPTRNKRARRRRLRRQHLRPHHANRRVPRRRRLRRSKPRRASLHAPLRRRIGLNRIAASPTGTAAIRTSPTTTGERATAPARP